MRAGSPLPAVIVGITGVTSGEFTRSSLENLLTQPAKRWDMGMDASVVAQGCAAAGPRATPRETGSPPDAPTGEHR